MPDYAQLKVLHRQVELRALQSFKDKAIGDDVEQLTIVVNEEIRKEF